MCSNPALQPGSKASFWCYLFETLRRFSSQGEGFGEGRARRGGGAAIRDSCRQTPRVALSLLLREQKQTLGEKKKYNAASLPERSSHDIRNHKAEAHARKERGEGGISWTPVLHSGLNDELTPSLHAGTGSICSEDNELRAG